MTRKQITTWLINYSLVILQVISVKDAFGEASTKPIDDKSRLNLDYEVEAKFIYTDRLNLGKISENTTNSLTQESDAPNKWERRLGLSSFILQVHWHYLDSSELNITIRPDALLDRYEPFNKEAREFDTRIGTPYRLRPQISLLDQYQLVIKPSNWFDISLGVFDSLENSRHVFEPVLDFALEVQHPRKFMALRLGLKEPSSRVPTNSIELKNRYRIDAYLFEGRNDRVETFAPIDNNVDYGPSSQDPYWGEALTFDYFANDAWQLSGLIGNLDTQDKEGVVNEVFASVSVRWDGNIGMLPVNVAYYGKWSHERWSRMEVNRPELSQASHSLTSVHDLNQNFKLFWGVHYGLSERHKVIDPKVIQLLRGEKLDVGWNYQILNELAIKNVISIERRNIKESGTVEDIFIIDDKKQRDIMRFAVELNYFVF